MEVQIWGPVMYFLASLTMPYFDSCTPVFHVPNLKSTAPRQVCARVCSLLWGCASDSLGREQAGQGQLAFLPTRHSHHGIVGFCVRPFVEGQRSMLTAQDCLSYNVQEGVQPSVMEAVSEDRL